MQNEHVAGDAVYLEHLAAAQETLGVVAAEDIVTEQGLLLAPKGAALNARALAQLRLHTVSQSIDTLFTVGRTLSAADLHAEFLLLLEQMRDWRGVHRGNGFEDELRHLCFVRSLPHGLMNRLSVMRERLRFAFDRSLFVAWFTALVLREQRGRAERVYAGFIAGLFHDLGLVHIEPELASRRSDFSASDWTAWGRHSRISARKVQEVGLYDEVVVHAIREHHERRDGSGAPAGLKSAELGLLGQLLALGDVLFELSTVQKIDSLRVLAAAKAYVLMNAETHFAENGSAVLAVLARAERSGEAEAGVQAPELARLRDHATRARAQFAALDVLLCTLDGFEGTPRAQIIKTLAEQTLTTVRRSGLFSDDIADWLDTLEDISADLRLQQELHDLHDTYDEITWQVRRAARQLQRLMDEELPADHPGRPLLEAQLDDLRQISEA